METTDMSSSSAESGTLPNAWSQAESWRAVLGKSVQRRIRWIRGARRIRRDIDELRALDDRLFADIGLTREDFEHAARHGRLPTQANGAADGN